MWLLIFIIGLTAITGSASRPATKEDFIPMARALWEDLKDAKEHIGGPACDKNLYCGLLHDMLRQYPDPHKHILDYIYLEGQQEVPDDLQFMQEIYGELLWAFECDGVEYF